MIALLIFAIALFIALLVFRSGRPEGAFDRGPFSRRGFFVGPGMLNFLPLNHDGPIVKNLAALAFFSVLLTDGMRAAIRDLVNDRQLPGRALLSACR